MSPVTIREANEWLVRLRDDAATPADRAEFEAWRDADPRHAAAFARVSGAVEGVGGLGADLRAHLEARRRPALNRRTLTVAAMAAVALLAIGVGYRALAPQTYATAVGEQRTIALADGSRVELNTDTRITVRYADDARRIQLAQGEAVFDVAHDAARPFTVEAHGQSVRAVGTEFVVRVNGGAVSVLVIEGAVAIGAAAPQSTGTIAPPPSPRLVAGQKLDFAGPAPAVATLAAAEIERNLAWRSGMLQFDGLPLDDAVEEVARYTGARFVIDDPQVRQLPVWAYFRAADLDGFLASLEQNIPTLAVQRDGRDIRILGRNASSD
jgi:transmembrane sensor